MAEARKRGPVTEYTDAIARHWWALVISLLFGVVGVIQTLADENITLPTWAWGYLALAAFSVAQVLAWRDVRRERDATQRRIADLLDALDGAMSLERLRIERDHATPGEPIWSRFSFQILVRNDGPTQLAFQVERITVHVDAAGQDVTIGNENGHTNRLHPLRTSELEMGTTFIPPISGGDFTGTGEIIATYWAIGAPDDKWRWTHPFSWTSTLVAKDDGSFETFTVHRGRGTVTYERL
jgi:hypothetical protein